MSGTYNRMRVYLIILIETRLVRQLSIISWIPFPCSVCITLTPDWKYARYYPMSLTCGSLNQKLDTKSANSDASIRVVSLATSCHIVKTPFVISRPPPGTGSRI